MRSAALGLVLFAAVAAAGCSKSDPAPTGTAPPRAEGASAPVAKAGGAVVTGERAAPGGKDTSFELATQQAAPASAGSESVARLTVSPGPGYKMNLDFPTKLTLEPPAGVTLSKTVLEPSDAESFTEKGLSFAVKMTAPSAGEYTIPATLKFAVCTEATCDPKKEKVALVLKAN